MKLRIECDQLGHRSKIIELMPDGTERELKNVVSAAISVDVNDINLIQLGMMIDHITVLSQDMPVECRAANRDGEVKQVRRVEYTDGTEDVYD